MASKEQEQANVERVLHVAEELNKLLPAEQPAAIAAGDEDSARTQLGHLQANAQKISDALAHADEEAMPEGITKDEEDALKKSKDNIRAYLKKLNDLCTQLQQHIDMMAELQQRHNELTEKMRLNGQGVESLQQQYQNGANPQPLVAAEDDLRRANSIRARLDDANQHTLAFKEWVTTALPQNDRANNLVKSAEETLNDHREQLDNLIQPLQKGIELAKTMQSEKNSINQKLDELAGKAKEVHTLSDPQQKSAELNALQQQINPLHAQLQQLEQHLEHHPINYVVPIENAELNTLERSMEGLRSLLSSEEKDAAKRLANAQADASLGQALSRLRDNIEKAERIDTDPDAKMEDMLRAKSLLEESSKMEIANIQHIADSLDPADEQANMIRNKAINEQSSLGEQSAILCQSLEDRADALAKFNKELAQADHELGILTQQLPELKSKKDIDQLLKKSEEILPSRIETLNNLADAVKPIAEPSRQLDAFLHRQAEFIANAKSAEKMLEEKEKQLAYNQQLSSLQDELKQLEKVWQSSAVQHQPAATLKAFVVQSVDPLLEKLQALEEAPTDELREQRKNLKTAVLKLKNSTEEKEKQAIQQEKLIKDIEAQLSHQESALAEILNRYEDAQPMKEAENDVQTLQKIKDDVVAIPLDEITEKPVREQLARRIDPLRAETNVSLKISEILFVTTNFMV